MPSPHVVFSGGGTGGHLFPGLAVAERLAADVAGVRITFAGGGKSLERRLVEEAGYGYLALACRPLPRGPIDAWHFVAENIAGSRAAGRYLREHPADVVVGLGGYASVPMARAGVRRGVPLVLLEQNAVPGRATRWLARRAAVVCTAFDQTAEKLSSRGAVKVTGNPVREAIFAAAAASRGHAEPRRPPWQLLILGGSSGARALNESVPKALYKLKLPPAGWAILHQSGERDVDATERLYRKLGIQATAVPRIDDMAQALAAADLAVCRAGGTTLAELAAARVPAVLVPYPHAADDHQRKNADVPAAAGAAVIVDQREGGGRLDDRLAEALAGPARDAHVRRAMSQRMADLARPDATREVTGVVAHFLGERAK